MSCSVYSELGAECAGGNQVNIHYAKVAIPSSGYSWLWCQTRGSVGLHNRAVTISFVEGREIASGAVLQTRRREITSSLSALSIGISCIRIR